MRRQRAGGRAIALDDTFSRAVETDARVARLASAEAGDARRPVWMRLTYSVRNPLIVSVAMCAPSQAEVFDRHIPRAELRQALQRRVAFPDLVMYPDALRGRSVFRFTEDRIAVTVHVMSSEIDSFLRETDALVPVANELDAMNAALAFALSDERLSDSRQ